MTHKARAALFPAALGLFALLASCSLHPRTPTAKERALGAMAASPTSDDTALVRVNGAAITRAEFIRRVLDKAGTFSLQRQIVDDELFRQEAERLGIAVSGDDVREAAAAFLDGLVEQRGGRDAFERSLEEFGVSYREFAEDLEPQLRSELVRLRVVQASRDISDDALREAFKRTYRHKRYLVRHVAYGFLAEPDEAETDRERRRLDAFTKAQRAAERVRAGHDFAEIARAESDDPMTNRRGGELPPIIESDPSMPGEFKEAIFALAKGQVSDPIANPQAAAYHIFQLTDVLPSESFVDCAEKLRKELAESEPTPEEVAAVLARLRARATVEWAAEEPRSLAPDSQAPALGAAEEAAGKEEVGERE